MDAEKLFESDIVEEIRDDTTWQKKVDKAENPVLVEFFVTWCPHCQKEAPVLDGVADQIKHDGIDVYHANAEVMWKKGAVYGLEETPSFILVNDGKLVQKHEGFLDADEIVSFAHAFDRQKCEGAKATKNAMCSPDAFKGTE